ncbi:hypothetical protein ASE63_18535 [Bosea sp. Root381]|uniref:hypothetical protein n=1 Tax=Bosea sp. Root381 TaxID=1736524 RepID=UPI0006FCBAC2|nr:hypothetical protein [Bosea sp. Root381]KRE13471.1 hypothetical protein ASE63_18535 [Bosea sp. Root381]
MASSFSPAELDGLLADHDTLANVDATIGTIRALGLQPRPDTIREQAALQEREPAEVELLVALIGRRLSSLEGAL